MSDADTKPGPASPQPEGADAATPPGGPQRQDTGGPGLTGGDEGVGEEASDSVEDAHGATIPVEDEQPDPRTDSEEDAVQQENAETSQDQPSNG